MVEDRASNNMYERNPVYGAVSSNSPRGQRTAVGARYTDRWMYSTPARQQAYLSSQRRELADLQTLLMLQLYGPGGNSMMAYPDPSRMPAASGMSGNSMLAQPRPGIYYGPSGNSMLAQPRPYLWQGAGANSMLAQPMDAGRMQAVAEGRQLPDGTAVPDLVSESETTYLALDTDEDSLDAATLRTLVDQQMGLPSGVAVINQEARINWVVRNVPGAAAAALNANLDLQEWEDFANVMVSVGAAQMMLVGQSVNRVKQIASQLTPDQKILTFAIIEEQANAAVEAYEKSQEQGEPLYVSAFKFWWNNPIGGPGQVINLGLGALEGILRIARTALLAPVEASDRDLSERFQFWDVYREAWNRSEENTLNPETINRLRGEYGAKETDLMVRAYANRNNAEALEQLWADVDGDPEAEAILLRALNGISGDTGEAQRLNELYLQVAASDTGNLGNILAGDYFKLDPTGSGFNAVRDIANVTSYIALDPFIWGGKALRAMKFAKFGFQRMSGTQQDVRAFLSQPGNRRWWESYTGQVKVIAETSDPVRRGELTTTLLSQYKRFGTEDTLDVFLKYQIYTADDAIDFLSGMEKVEKILRGQSVPVIGFFGGSVADLTAPLDDVVEASRLPNTGASTVAQARVVGGDIARVQADILRAQSAKRATQVYSPHMLASTALVKDLARTLRLSADPTRTLGRSTPALDDALGDDFVTLTPQEQAARFTEFMLDDAKVDQVARALSDFTGERTVVGRIVDKLLGNNPKYQEQFRRRGWRRKGFAKPGAERTSLPEALQRKMARWSRLISRMPNLPRGLTTDTARDARAVYDLMLLAGVPRSVASEFRAMWITMNPGQRQVAKDGLIRTWAVASGIENVAPGKLDEILAPYRGVPTSGQRYAPDVIPGYGGLRAAINREVDARMEAMTRVDAATMGASNDSIPIYRVDPKSDGIGWDKPHGLYVSPIDDPAKSPHRKIISDYAGGEDEIVEFFGRVRKSDVVDVAPAQIDFVGLRNGPDGPVSFVGDADAGVSYLINNVADADEWIAVARNRFNDTKMSKEFEARLVAFDSTVDWTKYFDNYERLMAVGGIQARRDGIKVLRRADENAAGTGADDFSELVILDRSAVLEGQGTSQVAASAGVGDGLTLPRELAGAKPRLAVRDVNYKLDFPDDVTKALYIVRDSAKRSKRDEEYMSWLRDRLPGMDDASIRVYGDDVRASIRDTIDGNPGVDRVPVPQMRPQRLRPVDGARQVDGEAAGTVATVASSTDGLSGAALRKSIEKQVIAEMKAAGAMRAVDPSRVNGQPGAIFFSQTAPSVAVPNFSAFDNVVAAQSYLSALLVNNKVGQRVTDLWTFGTLAGPRFQLRNGIEDIGMYALTGGKVGSYMRGRVNSQVIRQATERLDNRVVIARQRVAKVERDLKAARAGEEDTWDLTRISNLERELNAARLTESRLANVYAGRSQKLGVVATVKFRAAEKALKWVDDRPGFMANVFRNWVAPYTTKAERMAATAKGRDAVNDLIVTALVRQRLWTVDNPEAKILRKRLTRGADLEDLTPKQRQMMEDMDDLVRSEYAVAFRDEASELARHLSDGVMPTIDDAADLTVINGQAYRQAYLNSRYVSKKVKNKPKPAQAEAIYGQLAMAVSDGTKGQSSLRNLKRYWDAVNDPQGANFAEIDAVVNDILRDMQGSRDWALFVDRFRISSLAGAREEIRRTLLTLEGMFTTRDGFFNQKLYSRLRSRDENGRVVFRLFDEDGDDLVPVISAESFLSGEFDTGLTTLVRESDPYLVPDVAVTGIDRGWAAMGRSLARMTREPIWYGNYMEARETLRPFQKQWEGIFGERYARKLATDLAGERAYMLTVAYVDNPAIRSQLAWNVRNVARFYRATEDFARRLWRTARNNPMAFWKATLVWNAAQDTGFIMTDQYGEEYFIYPGSRAGIEVLNNLSNKLGFGVKAESLPMGISGNLQWITPSADPEAWVPTLSGPWSAVLYRPLLRSLPGLNGFTGELEKMVFGDITANQRLNTGLPGVAGEVVGAVPSSLPPIVNKLLLGVAPSLFGLGGPETFAGRMAIRAALALEAAGFGLRGDATEAEVAEYLDQLDQTAMNLSIFSLVSGLFLVSSPQMYVDDISRFGREMNVNNLRPAFLAMLRQEMDKPDGDPTNALIRFTRANPGMSIATVSATEAGDYGYMATTKEAAAFVQDNMDLWNENPFGVAFFAPVDGEESLKAFLTLRRLGVRVGKDIETYVRDLATQAGYIEWRRGRMDYEDALAQATTDGERSAANAAWTAMSRDLKLRYRGLEGRLEGDGGVATDVARNQVDQLYAAAKELAGRGNEFAQRSLFMFEQYLSARTSFDSIVNADPASAEFRSKIKSAWDALLTQELQRNPDDRKYRDLLWMLTSALDNSWRLPEDVQ